MTYALIVPSKLRIFFLLVYVYMCSGVFEFFLIKNYLDWIKIACFSESED